MNDIIKKRFGLTFSLVLFVFAVILAAMMIAGFLVMFLHFSGAISFKQEPIPEEIYFYAPLRIIFPMMLFSTFLGTAIAAFFGKKILKPIRRVIAATHKVAAGDFNVRVELKGVYELEELSHSFNKMAHELSAIETLRSDFISNVSHEYKTPVASIRGFARRLKKDTLTLEQRNEYVDIIISESERLSGLSGNVLLLSSLESAEKTAEEAEYPLDEQIRRTILLLEPQLLRKKLEVDVNLAEVRINANEEMLSHLWINLLGNAIKFSPDGGTISVSLDIAGNEAVTRISDTGIGMDEEVQKRIFDKFYQGDGSRSTEGNGLGMSLVKRILEIENGRIEVKSKPRKGSCFTVFLPM
ncbi:MAG: HAMP domain-containing histidine kinase [Oscillospiraceae bacterium]|nr:HAMP domain-containing histidine kinase [Oscillospiraceae bacterium]